MGSDRSMRQSFLVVYDYGQGGIWAFVTADSEDQITDQYPELRVTHQRPDWMSDEEQASIRQTDSYDIDEAPKGLLADIVNARS